MNQAERVQFETLRESFGRVAYSHKTHEKMADRISASTKWLKRAEVTLIALTAGTALGVLVADAKIYERAVAILAAASLLITLYQYRFSPEEVLRAHRSSATKLWAIRERYCALMTDLVAGSISADAARLGRNKLLARLKVVYDQAPQTDARAYKAAQQALKLNEELSFSTSELDAMLPPHLRGTDSGQGEAV